MNGHLITVEVGVEALTHKRVNPDRVTFDQNWLKSLNTHTVQSRGSVQQHRMIGDHLFKNIPNLFITSLKHPLGALDRVCVAQLF